MLSNIFNYKTVLILVAVCIVIYCIYLIYERYTRGNTNLKLPISNESNMQTNQGDDDSVIENIPMTLTSKNNPYFDISIDGVKQGRVVFELFDETVPLTCKNFRYLCKNNILDNNSTIPSYQGSVFHRVIKDFMIQGGDFTNHDGTGGVSIYGDTFDDESFALEHNQKGLLSMANRGPNTNGSQFFILLNNASHLDNKHVVFGIVLSGFNIIEKVENVQCNEQDMPLVKCEIVESGIMN